MTDIGGMSDRTPSKPVSEWSQTEIKALLEWYASIGVDAVLSEEPVDRFAPPPPAELRPDRPSDETPDPSDLASPQRLAPMTAAPPDETEADARRAAASATTMEELREALAAFEGCNLRHTATNLVFSDGNSEGRVMLVGEAPGREEDLQGVPFVGRSGKLLDRMLAAIGLGRDGVYIANIVPWRPPGNRTPTPQETAACRPFVERQIALCDPDFLVCLGNAASRELFSTNEGILRTRGRWREYICGPKTIKAMAMLHPAYLLRQPLHKRLAWKDLLALKLALAVDDTAAPPRSN